MRVSTPEQKQHTLWRCWLKLVRESLSAVKQVLYLHELKGQPMRRKPSQSSRKKKPDYSLQMCTEKKTLIFRNMSCDLMKQKWKHLVIKIKEKGESLQAWEHHPNCEVWRWQHHVVGVFCCSRDWWNWQNRWHHEERTSCRNIEVTSQDISQEVKAWGQMGLPNGQRTT